MRRKPLWYQNHSPGIAACGEVSMEIRYQGENTYWFEYAIYAQILQASEDKAHEGTNKNDEKREVVAFLEAERMVNAAPKPYEALSNARLRIMPRVMGIVARHGAEDAAPGRRSERM